MKHFLLYMIFLLFCNSMILTTNPNSKIKKSTQSFYDCLFSLKELCTLPFYACFYEFFVDETKVEKSKILCSQCNAAMNAFMLWGWLADESDALLLHDLKNLIYYGSSEKLSLYVLQHTEERQIPCYQCNEYHGYYIPQTKTIR